MKTFSTLLIVAALCLTNVDAHGKMTTPAIRLVNAKYMRDAHSSLRGGGNGETQVAPVELLNARGQPDQPAAPTFDIMNGCRGIEYDPTQPVTDVTPGQELDVAWQIVAPHPGYLELRIVRPTTEASGMIMYNPDTPALKRIGNFGTTSGSTTVTIPSTLSGCDTPGNCALQWYWHSEFASQTYINCADIVVGGSGGAQPTPTSAAPASNMTPAPAATESPSTPATPAPTTPPATTAPAPAAADNDTPSPTKACTRQLRK